MNTKKFPMVAAGTLLAIQLPTTVNTSTLAGKAGAKTCPHAGKKGYKNCKQNTHINHSPV